MRGSAFYKVVFFFPQVLSVAILAVLFQAVYRSDSGGLLNGVLVKLRAGRTRRTPSSGSTTRTSCCGALLAIMVWASVGFYLVLFSAAMQSIPRDIYEAALLDGADRARRRSSGSRCRCCGTRVQTAWVYLAIVAMDVFALVSTLTPGVAYGAVPTTTARCCPPI